MFSTQCKNVIEFQIPTNPKYVAFIRKSVRCIAEEMSFSENEAEDVEIAVGEAVTNSIVHGKPDNGEGTVTVRCRRRKNALDIFIEDEGRCTCIPSAQVPLSDHEEHGRGYLLMNQLMEHVQVRCTERGLLLSMTKKHRPRRGGKLAAAG